MQSESHSPYTQDPGSHHKRVLGLEPKLVWRIFYLGWPVIIGMLSQTAINTIDLILVGRLPDEIAVSGSAAMLSSIVLLWGFGGFLSAISVGTQALSARRFSEGNFPQAGQILANSVLVSLLASTAMFFIAEFTLTPLMTLLSPTPLVREIGESYCHIRFIGLFSMALMASYKSFYDGIGRVRVHMVIAIFMNIVNLIFSFLFIFGFSIGSFKVRPMYVDGAAVGAVVSSFMGLGVMLLWTLRRGDRKRYQVYRISNIDWRIAFTVARLSFWSGLATVVLMTGVGMFNYIVGLVDAMEGGQALNSASASIIIHVMMLVFMSALAFGTSTATLVAQSIGAKKPELAARYTWQSVRLAVYGMGIFGVIAFLFPEPILQLFLPTEVAGSNAMKEAVIALSVDSFRIAALFLSPIAAAALVLTQALYGAGQTRFVMAVEFVLHFFLLMPLSYILAIHLRLGLKGCWIAGAAYAALLLVATATQFWRGTWKQTVL